MPSFTALIDSAESILHSKFDPRVFLRWQSLSFKTLTNLLGPLHYYSKNFNRFTSESSERSLVTGQGILIAARELCLDTHEN
jgi:hypothetical protein